DISAYSGGSQVKNLQSGKSATVDLTYTKSELTTDGITTTDKVGKLSMVSYSDDKQEWESLSTTVTYKDSDGLPIASPSSDLTGVATVVFTAVGTHFSPYALSEATGINPPDVPGGISATAGGAGSGQITIDWSASSGATGYYIYRDTSSTGSFPLLTDAGNVTSYANTGLTSGTTYYYKVSAYKNTGSPESAASNSVNASVSGNSGGGGGGGIRPIISSSSSSKAPVLSSSSSASKIVPATTVANPSSVARLVSPVFNRNLVR
ncbi:MAG: fibronectin type III domain-containing protein, partial [Nanoarchaeota archaeon]